MMLLRMQVQSLREAPTEPVAHPIRKLAFLALGSAFVKAFPC